MLRLGILGLGEGRSTISAALASEKYELKLMCDLSEELCRQRAKEFDFHSYTTSYEQMLNDAEIDVIAIYTPDHLHADHVTQALLHDKHVYAQSHSSMTCPGQTICWNYSVRQGKKFL